MGAGLRPQWAGRSAAPPDLIDKIGRGVTALLALFATGIALVLGLALLVAHPRLIIFSLPAFWLWRKTRRPAGEES